MATIKWGAGWRWRCKGAQELYTQRHLASREDCESTQRFRRNSQELRHPDVYRNGTETSSNPKPCIPTIVKCAGGSMKQVHWNRHAHTHTRAQKKLNIRKKTFVLYFIVYIFILNVAFCYRECKGTKFLYILSPKPSFSSPHLHFRPPKPIHFLISIPPTYFHWSYLFKLILLKTSEVFDIHFQYYL